MSRTTRPAGSRPSRLRPSSRIGVLVVLIVTALGFGAVAAGPASALGYSISYSIHNQTNETLYFESAHNNGGEKCVSNRGVVACANSRKDFSSQVSPTVVTPGNNIGLYSELNISTFRQEDTIVVTYRLGTSGNDKVVLHTDPYGVTCTVHGTQAYTCEVRAEGVGRDFILYPVGGTSGHNPHGLGAPCFLSKKYCS